MFKAPEIPSDLPIKSSIATDPQINQKESTEKKDIESCNVVKTIIKKKSGNQKKEGGYRKWWLCIPNSVEEFPNQINDKFKKMCKLILQQNQPPHHFIISLYEQKLPSTFKAFAFLEKVVPHNEEKKSLNELRKMYKVVYVDPEYETKRESQQVSFQQKLEAQTEENIIHENLCYKILSGDSIHMIIEDEILQERSTKKAKVLSAGLSELRQLTAQTEEVMVSEFRSLLMKGIPLREIQEDNDPVDAKIFERNFIKLYEFANYYDKFKEEEIYVAMCQEIRMGGSIQEIEDRVRDNPRDSRVFFHHFDELNNLFQQTQQEIFSKAIVDGQSLGELQKMVTQKNDRTLAHAFLRSYKDLKYFGNDFLQGDNSINEDEAEIIPYKKIKTEVITPNEGTQNPSKPRKKRASARTKNNY